MKETFLTTGIKSKSKHTCTLQHTIVLTTTFYKLLLSKWNLTSVHMVHCVASLAYGYAGGAR